MNLFKKIALASVGAAMAIGAGVGVALNSDVKSAKALNADVVDTLTIKSFTDCPTTYQIDGSEYEYAAATTGNNSGTLYSATGINTSNNVRGNKTGLSNFNLRNKTTYSNYFIAEISLTVSGGTIDGSTEGRSVVYFNNVVYTMSADLPTTGGKVLSTPASSGQTTLKWSNTDVNVSYFVLCSLKTTGTCTCTSLTITWKDANQPSVTISSVTDEVLIGSTLTLSATTSNPSGSTVTWTIADSSIASIDSSTGVVTGVAHGSVTVTATITVDSVNYTDTKIIYVSYVEPTVEVKTLAEIIAAEYSQTVAYSTNAVIQYWGGTIGTAGTKDKYGNMILMDDSGANQIIVYGATFTSSALTFNSKTGNYVFSNPQTFLTNALSAKLETGDRVSIKCIRCDYNGTKELSILITGMANGTIIDSFVSSNMHMDDYDSLLSGTGTNLCYGTNGSDGYYATAKVAFNTLTTLQRTSFSTETAYANPCNRLIAWATACGESLNGTTYTLGTSASRVINSFNNNSSMLIILVISMASLVALGGFILLKKKKEN